MLMHRKSYLIPTQNDRSLNHKTEMAIGFGVDMKNYFLDNCLSLHQLPPTHIIHVERTWVVHI